ncbi:MAG TPA: YqgE/AlgH family protein [Caulobacteraceae bacterium]|jgi:putative transcriptional regulator
MSDSESDDARDPPVDAAGPPPRQAASDRERVDRNDDDGFLAGRLLVAMPGIGDPRFERAVVFLCAHNAEHAMGLAVNRPVNGLSIGSVLMRLKIGERNGSIELPQDPVLMGGPVERDRGFVLHTDDYVCPTSSEKVAPGIALTATPEVLEAIAGHNSRPRRSLLALGYAGWEGGQLEREIVANTWLICDADEDLIFDAEHDTKWERALAKIGVKPGQLSSIAGEA